MHLGARGFVHPELIDPGERRGARARGRRRAASSCSRTSATGPRRCCASARATTSRCGRPCRAAAPAPRVRCIGRTDDMLIVRGVNVFPSAVREVVSEFAPAVSGHILVRPPAPRREAGAAAAGRGRARAGRDAPTPRSRTRSAKAAQRARRADAGRARAVGQPAAQRVQVEARRAPVAADAPRASGGHGHVPVHRRRGLDEAAGRARGGGLRRGAGGAPARRSRRVRAHGGVEVDTQGDAFFVAFPTAAGALAAARGAHGGAAPGRCGSAIGLHTGEPLVTTRATSARTCTSRHGSRPRRTAGRSLLSAATAALVARDGLRRPRRAPAQGRRGAGRDLPARGRRASRRSRRSPTRTCRDRRAPFVGRERELAEVLARSRAARGCVTLTGPGGSGKTRLALEAAAALVPEFKAGVFWVGLAAAA